MKKLITFFIISFLYISVFSQDTDKWELIFEDNFNGKTLNTEYWSYAKRATSDWNKHLKDTSDVVLVKEGHLILRGIKNTDATDKVPYWSGGITTKDKFSFQYGKIEVRAKFTKLGKGGWRAIWLMPQDNSQGWPKCGEIDIMEQLNYDNKVYQTIHSNYTWNLGIKNNPSSHKTTNINKSEYNVYGLEWYPDRLDFTVNGKITFTYPKIETDKEGQWPFDKDFYIILNEAVGGSWVGNVNDMELPFESQIDWVKVYKERTDNSSYKQPLWEGDLPQNNTKWKDTYVKKITSEGAINELNYSASARPESYYTELADTLIVNKNSTFSLNLDAFSLGEYNESQVHQDLRYTCAYVFEDFEGDKKFTFLPPKIGNNKPKHNVGGNIDVLNIERQFTIPDFSEDKIGRIRVVYENAWKAPRISADSPVKEGLIYDINVKIKADDTGVCNNYLAYPIKITKNMNNIIIDNLEGENRIRLYDFMGRIIYKENSKSAIQQVECPSSFSILEVINDRGKRFVAKI